MHRRWVLGLALVVVLACFAPGAGWAQAVACPAPVAGEAAPVVHVRGAVERALELSASELEELPRQRVRVEGRDGDDLEYEGVALADVLEHAGVPMEWLSGPLAATVVVAEARDGYRAAYALGELREDFSDRRVLLADRKNGEALAVSEGPFRIIMDGERRRSRWVQQVVCLRVERL